MFNEENTNANTNSTTNQLTAQSPWKKPKLVSLNRTKSIKRKSDIFNLGDKRNASEPFLSGHQSPGGLLSNSQIDDDDFLALENLTDSCFFLKYIIYSKNET